MDAQYAGEITVSDHKVMFDTAYVPAYRYLSSLKGLSFLPYHFRKLNAATAGTRLRYRNASEYSCVYDDERDTLEVSFPWDDSSEHIMQVLLWHIFELKRQRVGEYLFHASAVVRDGLAVVLTGPSESGKTTVAIDLCRNHGFAFYANDAVLVRLNDNLPHVMSGDLTIRLRLSSLREYNVKLAQRIFGKDLLSANAWDVKKDVMAEEIDIDSVSGSVPIRQLTFVRLDRNSEQMRARQVDWSDSGSQRYFHSEMAANIRGGIYAPMQSSHNLAPLFIPSLDHPKLFHKRIEFMRNMVDRCLMQALRGPLILLADYIDRMHRIAPPSKEAS